MELGELIDLIQAAREEKKRYEKEAARLGKNIEVLEQQILKEMGERHLEKAAHNGVTVSPIRETFPHVEDWGKFGDFIIENRYLHLLEKRPTVLAYRELLELGRSVPGVVPFVKTRLSVRTT